MSDQERKPEFTADEKQDLHRQMSTAVAAVIDTWDGTHDSATVRRMSARVLWDLKLRTEVSARMYELADQVWEGDENRALPKLTEEDHQRMQWDLGSTIADILNRWQLMYDAGSVAQHGSSLLLEFGIRLIHAGTGAPIVECGSAAVQAILDACRPATQPDEPVQPAV